MPELPERLAQFTTERGVHFMEYIQSTAKCSGYANKALLARLVPSAAKAEYWVLRNSIAALLSDTPLRDN